MNSTNETTRTSQPAQPESAAETPSAPAAQRTATVIIGDRLCTHCGYNLTGQTIMREDHYGLLIVRCPECSQVAAATEYPMLGRWANRWAAVLAALYLLFVLALLSATVGSIFGLCYGAGEIAGEGMAQTLSDAADAWIAEQERKDALAAQAQQPADGDAESDEADAGAPAAAQNSMPMRSGVTSITVGGRILIGGQSGQYTFHDWWVLQTRSDLLAQAGGWWKATGKEAFYLWIPLLLGPLVAGCMWAVVALRRRLFGKLVIAAMIMGLTSALCVIPMSIWLGDDPYWYWGAGAHVVGPYMLILSLAWATFWLVVGLLIGRPLARGLMRLFLPPRLRSSMALLWTADGLEPPKPV